MRISWFANLNEQVLRAWLVTIDWINRREGEEVDKGRFNANSAQRLPISNGESREEESQTQKPAGQKPRGEEKFNCFGISTSVARYSVIWESMGKRERRKLDIIYSQLDRAKLQIRKISPSSRTLISDKNYWKISINVGRPDLVFHVFLDRHRGCVGLERWIFHPFRFDEALEGIKASRGSRLLPRILPTF